MPAPFTTFSVASPGSCKRSMPFGMPLRGNEAVERCDATADDGVRSSSHAADGVGPLQLSGVPLQRYPCELAENATALRRATLGMPEAACGCIAASEADLKCTGASSFFLTVPDDAMSGAGILKGDRVVVDRSLVAEHGQIVLALIGERYRVARLFRFNGTLELRSQRMGREAAQLAGDVRPFVWGVVVAVMRSYAPGAA